MSDFVVVGGCVAPVELAPVLTTLQRETGCSYPSVYRGDDAADLLHSLGKHTQREIFNATPEQRQEWNILGQPNAPGHSTHELFSDSVAYPVPDGQRLEPWQCGIDIGSGEEADSVIAAAARHGWILFRPYPNSTVEAHHVNFAAQPVPIVDTPKLAEMVTVAVQGDEKVEAWSEWV